MRQRARASPVVSNQPRPHRVQAGIAHGRYEVILVTATSNRGNPLVPATYETKVHSLATEVPVYPTVGTTSSKRR
jgi:hypothetical protein